jgi:hypothetical protein
VNHDDQFLSYCLWFRQRVLGKTFTINIELNEIIYDIRNVIYFFKNIKTANLFIMHKLMWLLTAPFSKTPFDSLHKRWSPMLHSCVMPITVAAWFEAWTVFTRSNTDVMGYNPTGDMGICVYVVLRVGRGHATGWPPPFPFNESYWHIVTLLPKLSLHVMQLEPLNHMLIRKPCWWFIMLIFIPLFAMELFSGEILRMLLIYFVCKRGWLE